MGGMVRHPLTTAVVIAVAVSALILLAAASLSLGWRYEHDSPLMIYCGFLVAGGSVPYRDFFDMNMPGTYFVMAAMGRVFGWSDHGFRVFDLLCLSSISAATFLWMRRFGVLAALTAPVAFSLWYLNGGPGLSLQREYIALVPFTAMLAVTTPVPGLTPRLRAFAVGLLAGMSFLIKPQFLLLALPLLPPLLHSSASSPSDRPRRTAVAFVCGLSVPLFAMFTYFVCTGTLLPFIDMAANYWPLYSSMTGDHAPIAGFQRFLYIVKSTGRGVATVYAPLALIGLGVLDRDPRVKPYVWVAIGLLLVSAVYPSVSGQFWTYHWLPFQYVALCAASFSARTVSITDWSLSGLLPAISVVSLLILLSVTSVDHMQDGRDRDPPKAGVPDEIHMFLRTHMNPGDAVQPLDWTGGAVHGMLMARAPLATRFMYDFHFYHHISRPYIGDLRREFMRELSDAMPRFIVQILGDKPWPIGTDTTRDFPELQSFLDMHYATAEETVGYRVLQRIDGMPGAMSPARATGR